MYGLLDTGIISINSSSRGNLHNARYIFAVKIADLTDTGRCFEMPEMVIILFKET